MIPALLCAVVCVLCATNVILIVMVAALCRTNDALMKAVSVPYREASVPEGRKLSHYSMYQTKLPGDNE